MSDPSASAPIDPEVDALYHVTSVLGKGAYGIVYAATDRVTKREIAIKVISKAKANASAANKVEKEIEIMRDLDHPRILRMHNFIQTEANYNIIMEKVDGGELLAQMLRFKKYTERKACRVICNLLHALKHMHERRWMHCDLKPENLLLVKPPANDEEATSIKLADFGLSRSVKPNELPRTACGSPLYIAPEVLLAGIKRTRPNYDEKADLWSAGIICFLLLTGMIPFFGKTPDEIFTVVLSTTHSFNHKAWEPISSEAKDFVNRLLVKEPEHRMSAVQALRHPWIALSEGPDVEDDVGLPETLEGLRKFNAQQKLKGAIYGVEAAFKLAYLTKCRMTSVKPNSSLLQLMNRCAVREGDEEKADGRLSPSENSDGRPLGAIKELNLCGNYLGARGMIALADTLTEASEVEVLNLTNVMLSDKDLDSLVPFFIRPTCRLHTLICDSNELSHQGGRLLLELARVRPQFTTIACERNHIKDSILKKISQQCNLNKSIMENHRMEQMQLHRQKVAVA